MMKRKIPTFRFERQEAGFWDKHGVLDYLEPKEIHWSLDEQVREAITSGHRTHRLANLTIKIDPLFVQAIKKIATKKAIPYQSLIRSWLAKEIGEEIKAAA